MRDDAVLGRALPLDRGLGPENLRGRRSNVKATRLTYLTYSSYTNVYTDVVMC